MKTKITTEKKHKSYTVVEGNKIYCMPFILKYVLEKYLATNSARSSTPVAEWYTSLDNDRKVLIDICKEKERDHQ